MYVHRNNEAPSGNHRCTGKAVNILSVYLWPYVSTMPCACAIMSLVACPALLHFPTHLTNGEIFIKKISGHKMCVGIFSTTAIRNICYYKKSWARYDQKCELVFI